MTRADDQRLKDFAGTVVLLLLQGFLWRAAMFLTHGGGSVLRYGGFALLMLTVAVCVWRVARTRPAAWIALGGGVLQLVIAALTLLV